MRPMIEISERRKLKTFSLLQGCEMVDGNTLNKGRRLWGRFRKKRYVAKKGFSAQISKLSGETFHF